MISKIPWLKLTGRLLTMVCIALVVLVASQSKLIYFPHPYPANATTEWQAKTQGTALHFTTSAGSQSAYLQGNLKSPRHLWVVCAGNGSLALDWSEWLIQNAPKEDAYLLVDYPGYGECAGSPAPGKIRETFQKCIPAAWEVLGWSRSQASGRMRFFGHSLGAAATLIAAAEFQIYKGVLIAPFTSTMDMSRTVTGLPLGAFVWHRFDNEARLAELAKDPTSRVIILHGVDDEVIPCAMSRKLAAENPKMIHLIEISGAGHNTIAADHADLLAAAMTEISE